MDTRIRRRRPQALAPSGVALVLAVVALGLLLSQLLLDAGAPLALAVATSVAVALTGLGSWRMLRSDLSR